MLVFASDLHLTDNTTCATINAGAFEVFAEDLEWMTQQACRREGGRFEVLERVDLVLLGDVFDLLRTTRWQGSEHNPDGVMPWSPEMADEPARARAHEQLAEQVDRIVAAIIAANAEGLACLRALVEDGIEVHDAGETRRVPLSIWYMAGNHDWPLHVGLSVYDRTRERVLEAFGLAHPDASSFPHTPEDAPEPLREVLEGHRVYAQHGDLYDSENFQDEAKVDEDAGVGLGRRARSSLGDAIVIHVLNGLPAKILAVLDPDDPLRSEPSFVAALDELDNVRPLFAMPQWLASVLQRYETGDRSTAKREKQRREAVHRALAAALDDLLKDPFVRGFDQPWHVDTVDKLQAGAMLNRTLSLEMLSRLSEGQEHRVSRTTYAKHAKEHLVELQSRGAERRVEFIIYGHTHHPEVVPLDLDFPHSWVYLNAGTWRRVHRRCVVDDDRIEFLDYHVMSIVAVYAGDERSGRPYETWTGTLGLRPGS